ncbi:tRNA pseudouridine(38-40) synthase TruA [Halobacteriales archaeon Cl-PHB]
MSSRRAYRIAYDGTNYKGFQRQPDAPTVSDAILDALQTLDVLDGERETAGKRPVPPGYAAAGRTDAGVSATDQTVAFEAPDWLTPAAFNAELPPEIRAWASADVPPDFHATHDAIARAYTYYLNAPAASKTAAQRALDLLAGEHDFHNLTPDDTGTERDLETGLTRDGLFLVLRFRADGFPRQFVRRAVSVVAAVARGHADLERVDAVLGSEELSGPEGVAPAAPEPLVLTGVEYPVSFERSDEAAASARAVFDERRRDHETTAEVAGLLADR